MKTISRIHLKNFMSYADEEVVLQPGLNLIAPKDTRKPHHIGKTTIERALAWVCMNVGAFNDVVRQGATRVEVEITFVDGTTISRVRTERLNQYVLPDGTLLDSPGRSLPPEVCEATGIWPVPMGGGDESVINFSSGSRFFLDLTGPKRGAAIAAMFGADSVRAAQKLAEKERNAHHRRLQDTEQEAHRAQAVLTAFEPLDVAERGHTDLKEKVSDLEAKERALEVCQRLEANQASLTSVASALGGLQEHSKEIGALRQKQATNLQAFSLVIALRATRQVLLQVGDLVTGMEVRQNEAQQATDFFNARRTDYTTLTKLYQFRQDAAVHITELEKEAADCATKIQETEALKHELLVELGECPMCGAQTGGAA